MKTAILLTAIVSTIASVSPAYASEVIYTLENATSDTTECQLVTKPAMGKVVKKSFILSTSKKVTMDVFDVSSPYRPGFFYVIKKDGKVSSNIYIGYEQSEKNLKVHQPAFGSCGGAKTDRFSLVVGNVVRYQKKLGGFNLTEPVSYTLNFNNKPTWDNFAYQSLPAKK